jgi:hypothetical protein
VADLDVLFSECIGNVERSEAASGEATGIEPEAHRVFALAEDDCIADAGNAFDGVLDVDIDVVRDEGLRERFVRRDKADGENEVRVGLGDGDAGVVDNGRKTALNRSNTVLHVDSGDVEIVVGVEGYGDGRGAVVRAGGAHVPHALDAVDGLLENDGNGGLDVLGVSADVGAGDDDLRRRKRRIERDRQSRNTDGASENDQKGADRGEDRATNKKVYEQGDLWPGRLAQE